MAGRARYRQLVTAVIMENPADANRAALRLSCIRLNWGFAKKNGLTGQYIVDKAREYGLDVPLAREEVKNAMVQAPGAGN